MMMIATFTNSEGVICRPPKANHRCAPELKSMPELPIPGTRTAINMMSMPA